MIKYLPFVFLAAALSAACAGNHKTYKSSFRFAPSNIQCKSHLECPKGSACIQQTCINFDHRQCDINADCPDYENCYDGTCAMCQNDNDCIPGFICSNKGVCIHEDKRFTACTSFEDCSQGQTCIYGTCTYFCSMKGDNSNLHDDMNNDFIFYGNQICAARTDVLVGVLKHAKPCSSDSDCMRADIEQLCYHGYCENIACHSNSDCSEKSVCTNSLCKKVECVKNNDCSDGFCHDNKCVECLKDSQCSNAYCIHNQCLQCAEDAHCKFGTCLNNRCTGCNDDDECENHHCVDHKCVQCINDDECFGNEHCFNFQCAECASDHSCHGFWADGNRSGIMNKCFDGKCVECRSDDDCKTGLCDDEGKCTKCRNDDDCSEGFCSQNGECWECLTHSDCHDEYERCIHGLCHQEQCTKNSHCPSHQLCTKDYICRPEEFIEDYNSNNVINFPNCQIDEDCASLKGTVCGNIAVSTSCTLDGCSKTYQCRYPCSRDNDCSDGFYCLDGLCEIGNKRSYCSSSRDCKNNMFCSTFYGECILPPQINEDSIAQTDSLRDENLENALSRIAENEKTYCWHNSDCPKEYVCSKSGKCICSGDEMCPKGFKCDRNDGCICSSDDACLNPQK